MSTTFEEWMERTLQNGDKDGSGRIKFEKVKTIIAGGRLREETNAVTAMVIMRMLWTWETKAEAATEKALGGDVASMLESMAYESMESLFLGLKAPITAILLQFVPVFLDFWEEANKLPDPAPADTWTMDDFKGL